MIKYGICHTGGQCGRYNINIFAICYTQGGDSPINRQGGQWLKKIITPKKYLNSSKNTNCGEMGLARLTARTNCIANTPQKNCRIFMIFNKIMLQHPRNTRILSKIPGICRHPEKIPGIWMTPKKYLQVELLDPKKYHWPPCRFMWGVAPLGGNPSQPIATPLRRREKRLHRPSFHEKKNVTIPSFSQPLSQ